ncbi:MAG TPA: DEAD/DEAH box helicase [Mycobacterium sp.]|nr:DEAD/DEAH box helicase [Mycobacterium sp.]HTX93448.1 DEAD/DEAH box helicase [Mycobacterium sp.]
MTRSAEHGLDLDAVARNHFGWEKLTDDQRVAMRAVLRGRDALAVLPTGSGKSAIYQVPSLLTDGMTLVVSPFIALQEDQITAIEQYGAGTAVAINSGLRTGERRRSWESIDRGDADFVSPPPSCSRMMRWPNGYPRRSCP